MTEKRILPQGSARDAWTVYFLVLRLNLLGRRPLGRWAVWFDLVFRHRERCELLQWWQLLTALGGVGAGAACSTAARHLLTRLGAQEVERLAAVPCLTLSILGVSFALLPLLSARRLACILDLDLPRSELRRSWLFPPARDRRR